MQDFCVISTFIVNVLRILTCSLCLPLLSLSSALNELMSLHSLLLTYITHALDNNLANLNINHHLIPVNVSREKISAPHSSTEKLVYMIVSGYCGM